MTIGPMPWHRAELQRMTARLRADRVPHAMLIRGAEGIGKSVFAQALSSLLQCHHPSENGACSHCRSCQLQGSGVHPDQFHLVPPEPGKAIRIDEVRAMGDFIAKTPQLAPRKVVIIEPADALNRFAANSLLKNLEEPAGETVLILVSAVPMRLLPTIRSRCHSVTLPMPESNQALDWLQEQIGADAGEALAAARGRPMTALRLHETGLVVKSAHICQCLTAYLSGGASLASVVESVKDVAPGDLLEMFKSWLLEFARRCADTDAIRGRSAPVDHFCTVLSGTWTAREVHHALRHCVEAERLLASEGNPNWRLLLEDLLITWRERIGQHL